MKILTFFILSLICIQLYACTNEANVERINNSIDIPNTDTMKLKITVNSNVFTATLQNNATAKAFISMLPLTINMEELNGNEKYYYLSNTLPTNSSNIGTIQTGDLMLYGNNCLVIFYKSFTTSYSYTRLGRINNTAGLAAALGSGNATAKLELE